MNAAEICGLRVRVLYARQVCRLSVRIECEDRECGLSEAAARKKVKWIKACTAVMKKFIPQWCKKRCSTVLQKRAAMWCIRLTST